ncbi:MAG: MFS transporter, partial [Spirochaetales bacterium]
MKPQGFKAFVIVWSGQILSILASGMTGFALSIWTFQRTGSATAMGAVQVFYLVPFLLVSPFAGALIDRHSRKLMMAVSDLVAVAGTAFVIVMNSMGCLELWHLFLAASLNGLGNSFQWPAYSAAVSVMLPKEQYSRANGMLGLMEAAPNILAPILAGTLLPFLGLGGILAIDLATFFIALIALSVVSIPNPPRTAEGERGKGSLLKEAFYGFHYIFERPGLRDLLFVFLGVNLFSTMGMTLIAPMILARTGSQAAILGIVQACMSGGAMVGGLLMSIWKGFRRQVSGLGLGLVCIGLFGSIPFGLGSSLAFWITAAVAGGIFGA